MALARVALKNLEQRVPAGCRNYLLRPRLIDSNYAGGLGLGGAQEQGWSYGLPQPHRFSTSSSSPSGGSEGSKEVAVQSDQGGRAGRWRSLFPRRPRRPSLWRRKQTRDPFEMFRTGSLGNALVEAAESMNRVFESALPPEMMIPSPSQLAGKFKETDDSYKVRYDVPGLSKADVRVTVDDGVLRVRGERKVEEEEGDESEDEHWMSYGYYNSSLVLPDDAKQDDIKAELKDGVLSITIPKTDSRGKDVKEVEIH